MKKIYNRIATCVNLFVENIIARALSKRVDEILAAKKPSIDKMIERAVADCAKENISGAAILSEIERWVLAHVPPGYIWDFHVAKWVEENAPDAEDKFDEKFQEWKDEKSPDEAFDEKITEWVNENSPCAEVAFENAIAKKVKEELKMYDSIVSSFLSRLASVIGEVAKTKE